MKAKKKPLEKKLLSDYNIEFKKRLETIQVVGMCILPFFSRLPLCKLLISGRTGTPQGRWEGRERRWPDYETERVGRVVDSRTQPCL